MSCGKRCFETGDKWADNADCRICPDQDSGRPQDDKKYCAHCNDWHPYDQWPHEPVKESE